MLLVTHYLPGFLEIAVKQFKRHLRLLQFYVLYYSPNIFLTLLFFFLSHSVFYMKRCMIYLINVFNFHYNDDILAPLIFWLFPSHFPVTYISYYILLIPRILAITIGLYTQVIFVYRFPNWLQLLPIMARLVSHFHKVYLESSSVHMSFCTLNEATCLEILLGTKFTPDLRQNCIYNAGKYLTPPDLLYIFKNPIR